MAIKNDENLSAFAQRLLDLMIEKNCETPKALAECLLDKGLVKVKYRGNDITKKHDNAVGSVEKKIRTHLRQDDPSCLQGEFVNAYCKFFACSADYLFGYTQIRTPDIDVRQICEKTGLSEQAVLRMINTKERGDSHYNQGWSEILESSLYSGIINNWHQAGEQALIAAQKEAEINKIKKELQQAVGPDILDLRCDLEGAESDYKSATAAYSGLLFNISRNMAGFIENTLLNRVAEFHQMYSEALEGKGNIR